MTGSTSSKKFESLARRGYKVRGICLKYYTYIIQSLSDGSFYTGMTPDLKRRLTEHNSGHTLTTKKHLPWELIHSEEFDTSEEAHAREKYLKSGAGRRYRAKTRMPDDQNEGVENKGKPAKKAGGKSAALHPGLSTIN